MSYASYPPEAYTLLDKDESKNVPVRKRFEIITEPDEPIERDGYRMVTRWITSVLAKAWQYIR
jgi:hypothetical protein